MFSNMYVCMYVYMHTYNEYVRALFLTPDTATVRLRKYCEIFSKQNLSAIILIAKVLQKNNKFYTFFFLQTLRKGLNLELLLPPTSSKVFSVVSCLPNFRLPTTVSFSPYN